MSKCYRFEYRTLGRNLTNEEVNNVHNDLIKKIKSYPVTIR